MRILHVFFHDDINDNNIDKPKLKKEDREDYIIVDFFFPLL